MIKVVRHGVKSGKREPHYYINCTGCGCIFVCNNGDILTREKRPNGVAKIKCPECGKQIEFIPELSISLTKRIEEN